VGRGSTGKLAQRWRIGSILAQVAGLSSPLAKWRLTWFALIAAIRDWSQAEAH
jgi:hypothetical protein